MSDAERMRHLEEALRYVWDAYLDRCAACGREFTDGDDVSRYRVSRTPGEWIDEAMHLECENRQSEFQGGPEFIKTSKPKH